MDKDKDGVVTRRQLVCSKEGQRKVQDLKKNNNPKKQKTIPPSRRTTRDNCPASFIARLCRSMGVYYAIEFITEHNHTLTRPEHTRFLRSHRSVRDHDLAQVIALRKVSIKTSQAYEYLVYQASGYEYVGFTLKDLYNTLDDERREILVDGDAQVAISFMNLKACRDPEFYCFFNEALIDGLHKNVVRDPIVCKTKGTQLRHPTNDSQGNAQKKGGGGCTKCGQSGHNQWTCKAHSKDSKIGFAGGRKKQVERGGKHTKAGNTSHSNNLFRKSDHLATTNNLAGDESSKYSGSEDEGVPSKSISQSLIHHKEEARTFDFFVGYSNFEPHHSVASSHGVLVNSLTNNVSLSCTNGDLGPFTTY